MTENIYSLLCNECGNAILSNDQLNLCKSINESKFRYFVGVGVYEINKRGTIKFKLPE